MIDFILIGISLIWVLFASIQDIKTREVADLISYSLIIIGLFIRGLYSLMYQDAWFFIYGLIGGFVFLLFGLAMYYGKQWGGGDVKLLIGVGILLANYPAELLNYFSPNLNLNFLVIILINIFFMGGIWGLFYSIYIAVIKFEKFKDNFKFPNRIYLFITLGLFLLSLFFEFRILLWIGGLFVLFMGYLISFIKSVEQCMYKNISYNHLVEGDWISKNIYHNGKLIYKTERLGVSKEGIKLLAKYKIKHIIVKDGIPFVPAFLLGIIISLIFGNLVRLF